MTEAEALSLLNEQKEYFAKGETLDLSFRINALKKLYAIIEKYEDEIAAALKADLGKSLQEGYMCETGLTKSEISHMLRHIKSYAREKRVLTPLAQYVSRSYEKPSPYGTVLIMSPWNYPILLTLEPLADAIAAGNTAIIKPSAYSPATSAVMEKMLSEAFPPEYVKVVLGGRAENKCLLSLDVDYIFFTGSKAVGKEVMKAASEHLVPVTLELGGKSPCIVDKSANIKLAARRIVWGKFLNLGQTCVAPDFMYVDASVKDAFIAEVKKEIERQFGKTPISNPDYGKIISEKHYARVKGLIDYDKVVFGGETDDAALKIAPTVMDNVTFSDAVMGQEIFGPLMPVLTFDNFDEAVKMLRSLPCPLALYIFSSDKGNIEKATSRISFGGGCVNDTVIHLATSAMGFGGVGESGMGSYHGRRGFETFSHVKSIVDKKTFLDLPMRYQPFSQLMLKMIKMFVK